MKAGRSMAQSLGHCRKYSYWTWSPLRVLMAECVRDAFLKRIIAMLMGLVGEGWERSDRRSM